MGYLEKAREFVRKSSIEAPELVRGESFIPIDRIKLADFSKRNIALEVYSSTLDGIVWFCSNDQMAHKVINDVPGAVCYTARELLRLIKLQVSDEELIKIYNTKKVFDGKIVS